MQLNATSVVNATAPLSWTKPRKRCTRKLMPKDPAYKKIWKTGHASNDYEVQEGLIYLKSEGTVRRLCVPNHRKLRLDVIHNIHDAAIMAHAGVRRTQLAAAQWYF
ncbi:unnamed protein product [Phytophthora lilii]|uniref:Unnamed protein product n=1 Tax=Phytophthora lilii TaxID=2077276 RepID=A0A9W7CHE0_9STRA|nr:unnamed protein product [Phytophthora lilii]